MILAFSSANAQKTIRVNAIKANNYGVIYSLPKTSFEITLLVKKTTSQRGGEFYPYAQRYLGAEKPLTENSVTYTLENISVTNRGIPDKTNSFMVEFRAKTSEPFVYLREDGVIVTVNSDPEPVSIQVIEIPEGETVIVNPRRFLSQETLMAGSTARQAELVARQIFDLRRSRTDILTGEAENMPPDGNAYKMVMDEIDMQEKALTQLFTGTVNTEFFTKSYTIVPEEKNIDRMVITRFSENWDLLMPATSPGEPVFLSLKKQNTEGGYAAFRTRTSTS